MSDNLITFGALWPDGSVTPASGNESHARAHQTARTIAQQLGGLAKLKATVKARDFAVAPPGQTHTDFCSTTESGFQQSGAAKLGTSFAIRPD